MMGSSGGFPQRGTHALPIPAETYNHVWLTRLSPCKYLRPNWDGAVIGPIIGKWA
jgi:hypothetical protein